MRQMTTDFWVLSGERWVVSGVLHFLFKLIAQRHEFNPSVVAMAERILITVWMISFQVSLFFIGSLVKGFVFSLFYFGYWLLAVSFWLFYMSCWNLRLSESRVKLAWAMPSVSKLNKVNFSSASHCEPLLVLLRGQILKRVQDDGGWCRLLAISFFLSR